MKSFIKYTIATITGILITLFVLLLFIALSLISLTAFDSTPVYISDNSVLLLKLDKEIAERTDDNPIAELIGNEDPKLGLDEILKAIDNAKNNNNIKGIYIEAGNYFSASPAMIKEIRNALVDFKESGKFIVAYGDNYTQGAYYICSVANSVIINPQGTLNWKGLSAQTVFYKNLFEKIGVSMQVFKVGTYKSAVEPYILDDFSDANREQIETFTNEIWNVLSKDVAESRNIPRNTLDSLTNTPMLFGTAKEYKRNKFVDMIAYSDKIPQIISKMMGCQDDDYTIVSVQDVASMESLTPKDPKGNIIAVYYAVGEIVQESNDNIYTSTTNIASKEVIKDLQSLAEDENVKAVVLRVNSPGGDAFASEQIWHQVEYIKSKKPIIVSMGSYAASGGYYISCAANKIVAEPTTLTGSIGVFGLIPDLSELLDDKLGINFKTVKTHEYADMPDVSRPMNEKESAVIQNYVNNCYELFTKRCADGRGISQDSIKSIAEGRVWTGVHAKKIGLVDEIGDLDDAIKIAKKAAKLKSYTLQTYPNKDDIFSSLLEKISSDSYAEKQIKENLGEYYEIFSSMRSIQNKDKIQARTPFYIKFNL